ncbi:repeating unit O-acetyltransferase WefK [Lacticaseibacillus paracasei subsp. paracasei CNCM I-4649]|nr:repeating unit O-acetyltransferase WefK [Lacticaseibacillus paracasei subsp. paracasei CNCM I-4649]
MTKKIRFEGIDFLKFFAIFGVVCLHVAGSYFNVAAQSPTVRLLFQPIRFYYYIGTLSIPLFFCVNGFLILGKENVTYPYILRKVSLLLAPVILWAIFEFIVKLVTEREFVNPVQIGAGFLVQKGLFSQFWFIGALIIVQLTAPILNRLLRDHWTAFRVLLLVFGVVCLVVMFSSYYMRYPVVKSVIQTFRLWTWFFYFMMGAWLRRTQHGSDLSKNTRFCLFVFIVLVVQMGALVSSVLLRNGYAEYDYDSLFVMLAVLLLMLQYSRVITLGRSDWVSCLVHHFAANTMGIFIIHVVVLKIVLRVLPNFEPNFVPIIILIVFIVSDLITSGLQKVPFVSRMVSID